MSSIIYTKLKCLVKYTKIAPGIVSDKKSSYCRRYSFSLGICYGTTTARDMDRSVSAVTMQQIQVRRQSKMNKTEIVYLRIER